MVTSSPPALGLACEAAEPDIMAREPVMKGRLLANRLVVADTMWYGATSGFLAFLTFVMVAYVAGPGIAHTHNCNYVLVRACGACGGILSVGRKPHPCHVARPPITTTQTKRTLRHHRRSNAHHHTTPTHPHWKTDTWTTVVQKPLTTTTQFQTEKL